MLDRKYDHPDTFSEALSYISSNNPQKAQAIRILNTRVGYFYGLTEDAKFLIEFGE